MNKILHVDINSYFATLAQQENPFLRGKPIGIVKDEGRTCLIAVSKEAKKFGLQTGCSLAQAKKLCPKIITVPAQFDQYLDATHKLKAIFNSIAPDVYIYSLDEAFINLNNCQKYLYKNIKKLAQNIQLKIKADLGEYVTCNVGISHNYLLAKIASEISPKGSIFEINHNNKNIILASTSFRDICGIGMRLEKKLKFLGVSTPYQIRFYSRKDLEPLFGPFWSKELLRIAWGEDSFNLTQIHKKRIQMKSVSRSITGFELIKSEAALAQVIYNLTAEVSYKLRKMNLAGRYFSLHLSGQKQHYRAHLTLKTSLQLTLELFKIFFYKLTKNWPKQFKVIRVRVRVALLEPQEKLQPNLFTQKNYQQIRLYKALDKINSKYGLFTLRSARLLVEPELIRPEVTGFLGDRIYLGL